MNNIYKQPMTDSLPPSKGGRSFFHFQYQHYLGVVSAEVCYAKLISCIPYCGKTYGEHTEKILVTFAVSSKWPC